MIGLLDAEGLGLDRATRADADPHTVPVQWATHNARVRVGYGATDADASVVAAESNRNRPIDGYTFRMR